MKSLTAILICLFISLVVSPQYSDSQEAPKYEWKTANSDQEVLYRDGQIIGQWYKPEGMYYSWDGVKNGPAGKPPVDPPAAKVASIESWQLAGVKIDEMFKHSKEHITFGGRVIQARDLEAAIEGNLFADDSSKGYLVIISKDKAKRDAVYADWQKLPTDFTSRYNVWMAAPDHFLMVDRFKSVPRFYAEGDPTIVLQNATGDVLFRRPQAEQRYKSSDIQELLKVDPNYKPSLDPGGPTAPAFSLSNVPPAGLAAAGIGGAALLLFLFRRKRS